VSASGVTGVDATGSASATLSAGRSARSEVVNFIVISQRRVRVAYDLGAMDVRDLGSSVRTARLLHKYTRE
jgi:hypothetical protein